MSNVTILPLGACRGGVLVLHPWWGLNEFILDFSNRLAADGFQVLAVDLYDGKIARTIAEAEKLKGTLTRKKVEPLLSESVSQLQSALPRQAIILVGFSLGAWWALWLNEQFPRDIAATVLFYGTRGMQDTSTRSAFLGHFAETDPYVMDSGKKRLEKTLRGAGRAVSFHTYPGTGHWFFESDRPEYQADAAQLAWERTLDFLKSNLDSA
jgi:carboxymethylenebutenolidase